jgi:hypothetical protein
LWLLAAPQATPPLKHHPSNHCSGARKGIVFYRSAANGWQAKHDAPPLAAGHAEKSPGCSYVRWAASRWQHRARAARHGFWAWYTATYAKWACIHRGEGSWDAANGGYGGGLQFDGGFQTTYGSEFIAAYGAAGSWPVWAQLLAAERAFHGYHGYGARGFSPWPNTARACGLL